MKLYTEIKEYGRFPANVILDDSEVVRAGFPNTKSGGKMGAIKTYIRKRIQHIADQNDRLEKRLADLTIEKKLEKLLDAFIDQEITYEQYVNMATDLQMAVYFGDGWFFDELNKREDEYIAEQEYFEKIPANELEILEPLDINKLIKDYAVKKGLFDEAEI